MRLTCTNDIHTTQFGMFSLLIKERLYIGEAVVSTVVGIALGPYAINLIDPRNWGGHVDEITLEITRVVIAVGVFAVGVELPKAFMKKHWVSMAMMLGPAMVVSSNFLTGRKESHE